MDGQEIFMRRTEK